MKKDSEMTRVFSCFDEAGRLKNAQAFRSEIGRLKSSGGFGSFFDRIIAECKPEEAMRFVDAALGSGVKGGDEEFDYMVSAMIRSNQPWLRSASMLIRKEAEMKSGRKG